MVDVAGVPHRLENRVGETQDHDVLRGLLAEVVVDAVGLRFLEGTLDEIVQTTGTGQVGAEGFFHNDAGPRAGLGGVEAAFSEVFQNHLKLVGRGGEVEEPVATRAAGGVEFIEMAGERLVSLELVEFAAMIGDAI